MSILDLSAIAIRASVGIEDREQQTIDWLNISTEYLSFDPADAQIAAGTGLATTSGTLTIAAYPTDGSTESLNPLLNPERWSRGNPIQVEYFDEATETWKMHPRGRLRLLETPTIPHEGQVVIDMPVGCLLTLQDRRSLPDDVSGVSLGSGATVETIINRLAAAADLPALTGGIGGGTIPHPIETSNGYVSTMGTLAWESGYVLWIDSQEQLRAQRVPYLDTDTVDFSLLRGINEFGTVPQQPSEVPIKRAIAAGVKRRVRRSDPPRGESWSRTKDAKYNPASTTHSKWSGTLANPIRTETTRQRAEYVYGSSGEIRYPDGLVVTFNKAAMVLRQRTIERWEYNEADLTLKLKSEEVETPVYLIAGTGWQPYNAIADASATDTAYRYLDEVTREEKTESKESVYSLNDDDRANMPGRGSLRIASLERVYWEKQNRRWVEIVESQSFKVGEVGRSGTTTSGGGNNQPPQPDRMDPPYYEEEIPVSGECDFESAGGYAEDDRTFEMMFPQGSGHCAQYATMQGTLLHGRIKAVNWGTHLQPTFLDDYEPLKLGNIQLLDIETNTLYTIRVLADGLAFQHTDTRAAIAGHGLYLGLVTTNPDASVSVAPFYTRRLRDRPSPIPPSSQSSSTPEELTGEPEPAWISGIYTDPGRPADDPAIAWVEQVYAAESRMTGIIEFIGDMVALEEGVAPVTQETLPDWMIEFIGDIDEGSEPLEGMIEFIGDIESVPPEADVAIGVDGSASVLPVDISATGAIAADGTAIAYVEDIGDATGTLAVDGGVPVLAPVNISAAGTLAVDGAIAAIVVYPEAVGILAVDGGVPVLAPVNISATGDLAVDGSATIAVYPEAAGALAVDGAATVFAAFSTTATGTIAVDGETLLVPVSVSATGTLAVDGTATITAYPEASGTLAVDGAATVFATSSVAATGTIAVDGEILLVPVSVSATGTLAVDGTATLLDFPSATGTIAVDGTVEILEYTGATGAIAIDGAASILSYPSAAGTTSVDGSTVVYNPYNISATGAIAADGAAEVFNPDTQGEGSLTVDGEADVFVSVTPEATGAIAADGRAELLAYPSASGIIAVDGRAELLQEIEATGAIAVDGTAELEASENSWFTQYKADLTAAGQLNNVSTADLAIAGALLDGMVDDSLLPADPANHVNTDPIQEFYLWIGNTLDALLVKLVKRPGGNASLSNSGFVYADYGRTSGFTGDLSSYFETDYNPALHASSINHLGLGFYSRINSDPSRVEMGVRTSGGASFAVYRFGGVLYGEVCNVGTRTSSNGSGDRTGTIITTRRASNDHKLYRRGTIINSTTNTNAGVLPNGQVAIFGLGSWGPVSFVTSTSLGCAFITAGLTSAQVTALTTRVDAAMLDLSRNV
ncbi:MAG: hypothetical protein AAFY26_02125 [Cyanobacteria bacterium J06638_22]